MSKTSDKIFKNMAANNNSKKYLGKGFDVDPGNAGVEEFIKEAQDTYAITPDEAKKVKKAVRPWIIGGAILGGIGIAGSVCSIVTACKMSSMNKSINAMRG